MSTSIQEIAINFVENRSDKNFTVLYNRLLPGLKTYAKTFISDWDVCDEMVAVTLTKAYTYIDLYEPKKGAFSTWIYRICRNECLSELKRKIKEASLDHLQESGVQIKAIYKEMIQYEESYDYIDNNEPTEDDYLDAVMEEVSRLPDKMREPYEDFTFCKMPYNAIALKRGIPSNTVRTRIFNARSTIRKNVLKKFSCDEGEKSI